MEEGETRYQNCRCGLWRILVNGQETWRSSGLFRTAPNRHSNAAGKG
jgi:hypothetical protein